MPAYVSRMSKIYEVFMLEGNTLPIRVIRYNPNEFEKDGIVQRVKRVDREIKLIHQINSISTIKNEGLVIQYMYYDVQDGRNKIWNDPDYVLEECCLKPIV